MRLKPQTYALTAVTCNRLCIFQRTTVADLFLSTVLRYREQGRFALHGYAIMPDHVHLLLTPAESIEKTAQLVKGGFSFAVRELYKGEIWQSGYHAHRITDDADYANQLRYIANNPVRKNFIGYSYVHTSGMVTLDAYPGG
jgi:putative transposase